MWEIRYVNEKGQEVLVLVGAKGEQRAIKLLMSIDKSYAHILSTRNCSGDVWFYHQGIIVEGK